MLPTGQRGPSLTAPRHAYGEGPHDMLGVRVMRAMRPCHQQVAAIVWVVTVLPVLTVVLTLPNRAHSNRARVNLD